MKRFSIILLSLLTLFGAATVSGCGCDSKKEESSVIGTTPKNYVKTTHYASLEEAIKETGIDIKIPESFAGAAVDYKTTDYSYDSKALEVTYKKGNDSVKIRKGKGTDSVNTFKSVEGTSYEKTSLDKQVIYSGFNTTSSSEWTTDAGSYAVIINGTDVKNIENFTEQVISINE